jgi:hypothetical protein
MKSQSLWVAFLASAALIAQAKTTVYDWPDWTNRHRTVTPRNTTPGVTCPAGHDAAIDCGVCSADDIGCERAWGLFAPNAVHVLYTPYFIDYFHHSKLLVMLGGGNSTPGGSSDKDKVYDQIYRVGASRGYHVIGLSYFDVNVNNDITNKIPGMGKVCGDNLDCYGDYMREVIDATDCGSVCDPAHFGSLNFEKHPQDTIENRLLRVLQWAARQYADDGWEAFLVGGKNPSINWDLVTVAGFSNGSSYAAYLGVLHPNVNRVALLNGPNDGYTISGIWEAAHYLKRQPGLGDTPYYALIHYLNHEDELYMQIGVYNALGMEGWAIFDPEPNEKTDFNGAHVLLSIDAETPPKDGHTSVVRDEYKKLYDHSTGTTSQDDCQATADDPYACTIGYEDAWRYIFGGGTIETQKQKPIVFAEPVIKWKGGYVPISQIHDPEVCPVCGFILVKGGQVIEIRTDKSGRHIVEVVINSGELKSYSRDKKELPLPFKVSVGKTYGPFQPDGELLSLVKANKNVKVAGLYVEGNLYKGALLARGEVSVDQLPSRRR